MAKKKENTSKQKKKEINTMEYINNKETLHNNIKRKIMVMVKRYDNIPISFIATEHCTTMPKFLKVLIKELQDEGKVLVHKDLVYTSESEYISLIESS